MYLGPVNGHLIGVDLSEKMIQQAARHGVYSRFHRVNMLDALRETPSDLFVEIDVKYVPLECIGFKSHYEHYYQITAKIGRAACRERV